MSNVLLSVENLSVSFKTEAQHSPVVKKISYSLEAGKTLALVGESGSGKSVSSLAILKLLPYPAAFHPSGKIYFKGQDLLTLTEKKLEKIRGREIAMIFQEPLTALNPLLSIEHQLKEVLDLHTSLTEQEKRDRLIDLLEDVGFSEGINRLQAYPHELSGGQRQRVMIAMALAANPKILIADEPTTALDVTTQRQILDLLQTLQHKHNLAVLLITHDLNVVENYAHKVAVMRHGVIVEHNTTAQLFENPQHPYTQELLKAEPSGCAVPLAPSQLPCLVTEKLSVLFPRKTGFFKRLDQGILAVNQISLDLKEGETLGIVGESGSGKSTLAMAILRLQKATSGKIIVQGVDITHLKGKAIRPLRRDLQIIFQDPFGSLNPRLSIHQIIGEGIDVHSLASSTTEKEALIIKVMQDVQLDPETRYRYPHEFSGGQRQRIAIARSLVLNPKILILDEPTSALDRAVQVSILMLLKTLQKKRGISYLFISHDLKVIKSIAHKIIVMKEGGIVEQGATQELFSNPKDLYTKSLIRAAFMAS